MNNAIRVLAVHLLCLPVVAMTGCQPPPSEPSAATTAAGPSAPTTATGPSAATTSAGPTANTTGSTLKLDIDLKVDIHLRDERSEVPRTSLADELDQPEAGEQEEPDSAQPDETTPKPSTSGDVDSNDVAIESDDVQDAELQDTAAEVLVAKGADINAAGAAGETPVMIARRLSEYATADALIALGGEE